MGSLHGHGLTGMGFIIFGMWHLFNHIKLHSLNPDSYHSLHWFPTSKFRHLELYLVMFGSVVFMMLDLFNGPARHHPFAADGTIPASHLHNIEHFFMALSLFSYAAIAIVMDTIKPRTKKHGETLTRVAQLTGAVFFAQELFLFHFHSTDHKGIEKQYHMMLEILISIVIATILIGIAWPTSFLVSYVRSVCILFKGIWHSITGVMIWIPWFAPKGCYLNFEHGHYAMRCRSDAALHRAKALVNIEFGFYVIMVTASSVAFYLAVDKAYGKKKSSEYHDYLIKEVELYNKQDANDIN